MKKTNKKMMILSFFGIIFVVLGHLCDSFTFISKLFPYYSFHMPLFVFISGYFYKNKYSVNLFKKDGYFISRVKKLVIPYYVWNLIYGIFTTILIYCGIKSYGNVISLKRLLIDPWIYGNQFYFNTAAWFCLSLFIINIFYAFIRKIISNKWNDYIVLFILLILACISIKLSFYNLKILIIPIRTFYFLFFYHLGYMYKNNFEEKVKINSFTLVLISFVIQAILLLVDGKITYASISMIFTCKYLITPIIAGINGIWLWLNISNILVKYIGNNKIVNYVSENTFDIMMHHLFWIFILNILFKYFGINNINMYVRYISYIIVGIFVPVFLKLLIKNRKVIINKR